MEHIVLINKSTVVSDADLRRTARALQSQIHSHFYPAWGTYASVTVDVAPRQGDYEIIIANDSDQAGALGYHETDSMGRPVGFVFAKTDIENGYSWSSTLSHEALEMLADPFISYTALVQSTATALNIFAVEVCDPVENDLYKVQGIEVSNFVFPQYFDTTQKQGPFDHMGSLAKPLPAMSKGGYLGVLRVSSHGGWVQVFGDGRKPAPLDPGDIPRGAKRLLTRATR